SRGRGRVGGGGGRHGCRPPVHARRRGGGQRGTSRGLAPRRLDREPGARDPTARGARGGRPHLRPPRRGQARARARAMKRTVLVLGQGTTGSTALVVDPDGRVLAHGYAELTQYFPQPGWVEHDPEEIWATVERAARAALTQARVGGAEVAAIGITNQRETTVLWDRATGAPIHRAIVWQCRRTAPICDRLRAQGVEPLVKERTGLVLDAYFSGTKIGWLLDTIPGARVRAERGQLAFGTVDAWLLWKLTGRRVHATDASNASRTLCRNP